MRALASIIGLSWAFCFGFPSSALPEDREEIIQNGSNAQKDAASKELKVSAYAIHGEKFGICRLLLEGLNADRQWQLEQPIVVDSSECRTWFPAWTKRSNQKLLGEASQELRFVFDQGVPGTIELYLPAMQLKKTVPVVHVQAGTGFAAEVSHWWHAFVDQSRELVPSELDAANNDLLESIGSLLGLALYKPVNRSKESSSQLEKEFERTLGMLLGFESVRLAMMTDESTSTLSRDAANLRLPNSLNIAPVPIRKTENRITPPSIANLVPKDCYLVRCQSLGNYVWLRRLLLDWGGSLNELVSSSVIRTDVRAKLEKQLVLSAEALLAAGAGELIEDMAVIGSDLLFEQGAGVGVLLKGTTSGTSKLAQIIDDMRSETNARSLHVQSVGFEGSFLTNSDNTIRSYYFRIGDYHLITNSSYLVRSVVTTSQKESSSLGELAEFKYALATHPGATSSKVLFYLSDPFFRRLASAPFRIELGRRRAAEADCRRLNLAAMMADATEYGTLDKDALIQAALLPRGFGVRCDGSSVELSDGVAIDSFRGRPGTFLPVVDVKVQKCNYSEQEAYRRFTTKYRQQWRLMDPVLASLDAVPADGGREKLNFSVHITPYAQSEYRFLTQYLGQPTTRHLSGGSDELMGISASLKDGGTAYSAHLGVKDAKFDFAIEQGQLKVDGQVEPNPFVEERSYAAVTPTGTQGLLTLNGLRSSLQKREPIRVVRRRTTAPRPWVQPRASDPFSVLATIFNPPGSVIRAGATALGEAFKAAATADVSLSSDWAIYSKNGALRKELDQELTFMEAPLPAEIHAVVQDVAQSAIAPYLKAHSFLESRHESAKVAQWLDFWTAGLKTDPLSFKSNIEQVKRGILVCPLGGQFVRAQKNTESAGRWISTKWQVPTISQVEQVPEDYEFAFLNWFKGLNLRFSLNDRSLESDIQVVYHPSTPTVFDFSDEKLEEQNVESKSEETARPLAARRGLSAGLASQPPVSTVTPTAPKDTAGPPNEVAVQVEEFPAAAARGEVKAARAMPATAKPAWIGIRINPTRMQVSLIKPDQPASRTELRVGDKVLSVNGINVNNLDELRQAIGRAGSSTGIVDLRVERAGQILRIPIQLDSPSDVDL